MMSRTATSLFWSRCVLLLGVAFVFLLGPLFASAQTTEVITAASSSPWTAPTNVYSVTVECWGGGGGGPGDGVDDGVAGGAGGGGAYARSQVNVSPGSTYAYSVGAGGTGGKADGTDGGNTTFNTDACVAAGGTGGTGYNGGDGTSGVGGSTAVSRGNIVEFPGGDGHNGTNIRGGGGGSSAGSSEAGYKTSTAFAWSPPTDGGQGGDGGNCDGCQGFDGSVPGGGGGSSGDRSGGAEDGGAGAAGQIRLTYSTSIDLSGTVFIDDGRSTTTDIFTVKLAVGTSSPPTIHTTNTDSQGNFSFTFDAGTSGITATTALLFWIDNSPTTTASTHIMPNGLAPITDIELWGDHVIIRNERSTSTSIADMSFYDNSDDTDVRYTATTTGTDSFTLLGTSTTLYIWGAIDIDEHLGGVFEARGGSIFEPNGNVVIQGSLLAGTDAYYIGSTTAYTLTFTGTSSGLTVNILGVNVGDTVFNGSGGSWDIYDLQTQDLTITNGTVTLQGGTLTVAGDFTQDGTFTNPGGTLKFDSGSSVNPLLGTTNDSNKTWLDNKFAKGIDFSSDGTVMIIASTDDVVYEVTLAEPFDLSTATSAGVTLDTNAQVGGIGASPFIGDIEFSSDGTKLYVVAEDNTTKNVVYAYDLSTPFRISTATYNSENVDINGTLSGAKGIDFNPSGTSMYVIANNEDNLYEFTMTTPWDLSTASYSGNFYDIENPSSQFYNLEMSRDGTRMHIASNGGHEQYVLKIPWDITTAEWVGTASGITGNYVAYSTGGGIIFGFSQGDGDVRTHNLSATTQTISGTLSGTSGIGNVTLGYFASTTFANNASTSNLTIESGGKVTAPTSFSIGGEFVQNGTFDANSGTIFFGSDNAAGHLSSATSTGDEKNIGTQETNAEGVAFKPDGTKMYVVGQTSDTVYAYDLSPAWDISSASYGSESLDVSRGLADNLVAPFGLDFSPDGTKMVVADINDDQIFEYDLSTPWDVSTAQYNNVVIDTTWSTPRPLGVMYGAGGKKLYISGSGLFGGVAALDLAVPYDLRTAMNNVVRLDTTDTGASTFNGSAFNSEGTRLYVADDSNVYEYALTVPWDITTAASTSVAFTVQSALADVRVSPDGSRLITIVGGTTDTVSVYEIIPENRHRGTFTGTSSLNNVVVDAMSGNGTTTQSVSIMNAASSTGTFTVTASSSVAFAAGATSTFNNVVWNGGSTTTDPVWIYSTESGTSTNLVVTGTTDIYDAMIRDANVCGSTGGGLTATNSVNVANNTCWTFASGAEGGGGGGGSTVTWDGDAADGLWESPTNWSGDATPTADDDVVIDTATTVSLNTATTVNSLSLGSSTASVASVLSFDYNATATGAFIVDDGDLIIYNGASITHATGSTNGSITGNISIDVQTGDLTINTGGSIDVDAAGYQGGLNENDSGSGPGGGEGPSNGYGAGGAYGGEGGNSSSVANPGSEYGSTTYPTSFGSGGGAGNNGVDGGSGGGLAIISVAGTTTLNGAVNANGGNGVASTGGGAAGGGINITTGHIAGAGSITANGGVGWDNGGVYGGSGSGGRVAIYYTTGSTTNLTLQAYGGENGNDPQEKAGAAGTIFTKAANQPNGSLTIDNNNITSGTYSEASSESVTRIASVFVDNLTATSGAIVLYGTSTEGFEIGTSTLDGATVVIDVTAEATSTVLAFKSGGVLHIATSTTFNHTTLNGWGNGGTIVERGTMTAFGSALTIPAGGTFVADRRTRTYSDLTVSGTLTHSSNTTTQEYYLDLDVSGDLTIGSGGAINLDGRGYSGPVTVSTAGYGSGGGGVLSNYGSGAAYGGEGGRSSTGATPGSAYGSTTNPVQLGSGGGRGSGATGLAGAGGGYAIITVSGTTSIIGSITADGSNSVGNFNGGGSGGAINLTTGGLEGSGSVMADGGNGGDNGTPYGGSGSGGRVAVTYTTGSTTNITLQAFGGDNGDNDRQIGAAGTIFTKSASESYGDLIINNNSLTTLTAATPLATGTAAFSLNNLTITGNASATVPTLLTLYGNYTASGTVDFGTGTTTFAGTALQTATGTMTGTSAFNNVEVTNVSGTDPQSDPSIIFGANSEGSGRLTMNTPNTKVHFQGGATTTWQNIDVTGTDGNTISLYSTSNGLPWNIDVTGTTTILYGNIKDSNALANTSGSIFAASSTDAGGNVGWTFSAPEGGGGGGSTITWDGGGADNDWETALNWSGDAVPTSTADVIIDSAVNVLLNGATTINSLTIGSSTVPATSTLTFNYNATSSGALVIDDGDLIVHASGTITHATGSTNSLITGNISIDVQTGDLTVESGGSININQAGYARGNTGNGPGGGGGQASAGGGASYGGDGGNSSNGSVGGSAYGSTTNPTELGSGGDNGGYVGGDGGGLAILVVSGTTTINGSITANGGAGTGNAIIGTSGSGGGSGGAINLTTGGLEGTGSLTANGGSGMSDNNSGGNGAGGRIAVRYTSGSTTGLTITANGSSGSSAAEVGAAGTIFTKTTTQANGDLIVTNGTPSTAYYLSETQPVTPIDSGLQLDSLTATSGALVSITGSGAYTLATTTVDRSTLTIDMNNTVTVPSFSFGASGSLRVATGTTFAEGTFTGWENNNTVIERGIVNFPSTLTVPAGATYVADRARSFTDLTVAGTLTHSSNGTSQEYFIDFEIAGDLTINSGGSINLNAIGYNHGTNGAGPGGGIGEGGGGAYGGDAGDSENGTAGGSAYGSTTNPVSLGSGGANGDYGNGAGGGLAILSVTGTTTINGTITANGENGSGGSGIDGDGGGSGGGINITTGGLAGVGTVRANGGAGGSDNDDGGGGSGGRIAIHYTSGSTTSLTLEASGGYNANVFQNGAAGTIYTKASSQTYGDLLITNVTPQTGYYLSETQPTTPIDTSLVLNSLTATSGARVTISGSGSYNLATTTVDESALLIDRNNTVSVDSFAFGSAAVLQIATGTTFDNGTFTGWENNNTVIERGIVNFPSTLTVPAGATYVADRARSFTDLTIDGTVTHTTNATTQQYVVDFDISGDLTINVGGTIGLNTRGYSVGNGPGAGSTISNQGGGGGAYGGNGGDNGDSNGGGSAYGSTTNPVQLGSGGGLGDYGLGDGGGLAILSVTGTTTINGTITANGENGSGGSATDGDGGGSGGGINITTGGLEGTGSITAIGGSGGNDNDDGGGGSGGRIAIHYTSGSTTGLTLQASGKYFEFAPNSGAAGTVYTKKLLDTEGELDIDNNDVSTVKETPMAVGNSSIALKNFTVTRGARALAPTTFTLRGDFNGTNGIFNANFGSLILTGASSTILGSNTFYNLSKTNTTAAPETLILPAGEIQTILNTLTLTGTTSGNTLYVESSSSSVNALIDSQGTSTLEFLTVSNNTSLNRIVFATSSSVDLGGNVNWSFNGAEAETCTVCLASVWNATDWTLYDTITIAAANIDAELTDFPVYVDLADLSTTGGFWDTTPTSSQYVGTDIRVTNSSNQELPRELVFASSTAQTGELHFKADSISSTTDTAFRIWYNGTTTNDYTADATYGAQNVWTNGYVGVWHMQEDPSVSNILDSTNNNLDATPGGSMNSADLVAGRVGNAINFDGADDVLDAGVQTLGLTAVNLTGWITPDSYGESTNGRVFDISEGITEGYIVYARGTTNGLSFYTVTNSTDGRWDSTSTITLGETTHFVSQHADVTNLSSNAEFYFDGVSETSTEGSTPAGSYVEQTASTLLIGNSGAGDRAYDGLIDELRLSSTTRSAAWISAEYLNQSTTTDFYTTAAVGGGGTGSTTLANSDAGQVGNAFNFQNKTNEALFAFKLIPNSGNATITNTTIDLGGATKVDQNDFTNIRLYADDDNDATYDAGDTVIDSSGVFTLNGQTGSITFTTDYLLTTATNYLVVADWNNPSNGSFLTFDLNPTDLTGIDADGAISFDGSVDSIQHSRNNKGGGGSSARSGGDSVPVGDGDVGGGTNDGGEKIGGDTNFLWPTANSGSWTNPANAYDQTDGTYATANSSVTNDFSTFNDSVPGTDTIQGIEVKLEVSGTTAAGNIGVELSWDTGSTYTTTGYTTGTLTTTDAVVTVGSPSDIWGRSWSSSEFSNANFRVRLTGNPSSNTVQVDAIQVRVYHQASGGGGGGGGGGGRI